MFVELDASVPEPVRLLRVVENLGARPTRGADLEFPVSDEDAAELAGHDLATGRDVCLHPGASVADRRWDAQHFAAAADALTDRGLRVVLTGVEAEGRLAAAVTDAMSARALDLTGSTSLGAMAAAVRDAALVICNDTGVSHLAAALGTPSVIVFHAAADIVRWAPADGERHRRLGGPGEKDVSVDAVLAEAGALLQRESRA
jgi:ADP-heptose:LPS heptosyltransferase